MIYHALHKKGPEACWPLIACCSSLIASTSSAAYPQILHIDELLKFGRFVFRFHTFLTRLFSMSWNTQSSSDDNGIQGSLNQNEEKKLVLCSFYPHRLLFQIALGHARGVKQVQWSLCRSQRELLIAYEAVKNLEEEIEVLFVWRRFIASDLLLSTRFLCSLLELLATTILYCRHKSHRRDSEEM